LLEAERLKAALGKVGKPLKVESHSLTKDSKEVLLQFLVHMPELPRLVVPLYVNVKGHMVEIIPVKKRSDSNTAPLMACK
jgi:hypothetical protein